MCGITGIVSTSGSYSPDDLSHDLGNAVKVLAHRGPDDNGMWQNNQGVGLGHTRLAILDLSPLGHQPVCSADGRYVLVFNGEIYNFRSVRRDLESMGFRFKGCGDTEVVLAAFEAWNSAAVDRFIGMFAIAIWDCKTSELSLYRDRLGVKPLYYGWDGKTFCFGSEIKALQQYRHFKKRIDLQAVGEYLQFGYISECRSIFQDVYKLPPGSRLTVSPQSSPTVSRYWTLAPNSSIQEERDDEQLETDLENLLRSAFSYRMVSDVPVGIYLSGGVDSTLVTGVLSRHYELPIRTFTIGFTQQKHDESEWARKIAERLGTQHTEYILELGEASRITMQWGDIFDEPFGDSSGIPTLLVSQLASQEVKVVLSADGGDELFSGYHVYETFLNRQDSLKYWPGPIRKAAAKFCRNFPAKTAEAVASRLFSNRFDRGSIRAKFRGYDAVLSSENLGELYDAYFSTWYPYEIRELLGAYEPPRVQAHHYSSEPEEMIRLWDVNNYLPENILTKVDRTTMLASIEGREPLLDHRIAEFAFALPENLRRGALGPKHVLKKILYKYVPREYVDRPKHGFSIPLKDLLLTDLAEMTRDYLSSDRLKRSEIFEPSLVSSVVSEFYAGDAGLAKKVWLLLAFELWREKWA